LQENDKEFQFFLALLGKNNQLIFDVGANTGEKGAIFKKIAKRVICFEPSPNSIRTLKNRFAFSNVTIFPIAISNTNSSCKLYVVENAETLNSINKKQLTEVIQYVAKDSKINTVNVQSDTLDNMIKKFGKPEYIKIDVEGSEREAIFGLSEPVNYLSFENCTPNFLEEGLSSIQHLEDISNGSALFNIYEAGKFLFKEFTTANEVKDHLKSHNYGAAEIFCRSNR
jgi:FkbM family methyltransferase